MSKLTKKDDEKKTITDLVINKFQNKLGDVKPEHKPVVAILSFVSTMSEITAKFADALAETLKKDKDK